MEAIMRRAAIYVRVSTNEQTTQNQERELRLVADKIGCEVVKVYRDQGISGAKGRDQRPAFDALRKDATQRKFDVVMAWSVDRLGRSLQDPVGFLSEIHALGIDPARASVRWQPITGLASARCSGLRPS
jgi:DNA invertase Pin-like site-specific DNA recombinase